MEGIKKIVFTVTNDLTYDQRMQRICTTLAENKYNITLVGFYKKKSVKTENKNFVQIRLKVFFKKGKLFFIEYNLKLFFFLLFKRYDIYCGIDLDTLLPVYINAFLKRKPCIYDAHEFYTELPEIIHRPFIQKIWLQTEKFLLPRIKYNYTVSHSIAQRLSKKYRQPYAVIRNVPYLEMAPSHITKKEYIIYQGALNKGRGIEQLFLAMKDISTNLYIAGEGDLSNKLRQLANELPYKNKIRFLGYVRPSELKKYTLEAKLGINLVENTGLSYYYSLSNKFFDYIHANIPQVTMNFPEYKTLNTQFEIAELIDNLNPESISAAINKLLNDKTYYEQLYKNTFPAKEQLNWQHESKKLLEFYKHVK